MLQFLLAQLAKVKGEVASQEEKTTSFFSHDQTLSSEADWDTAIEKYIDSLPNTSAFHVAPLQRSGSGVVMCLIQKYADGGYASAITFGYWRNPYFYYKDNGTWTVKRFDFVQ